MVSLIFSVDFLFSNSLISALILIISFLLFTLDVIAVFFFSFLKWKHKLLILYLSPFLTFVAVAAKSLQSCPTLCDPIDGSPPGFPIPGILQARTLEWVAISFSNA